MRATAGGILHPHFNPLVLFWPSVGAAIILVILGYRLFVRRRRKQPADGTSNSIPDPPSATNAVATTAPSLPASTPTPSTPLPPGALVALQGLPNRDKLLTFAKDRAKTGLCLYCDEPAAAHRPTFVPRKPPGEDIYTFFGGTTREVWRVHRDRLSPALSDAQEYQQLSVLCKTCAEIEAALCRDFLAARNAEYSAFALEQRTAFHEYLTYGVLEEMYRKLRAMRTRKDNTGTNAGGAA